MFNPKRQQDIDRLYRAVERSRWLLQPFREKRLARLKEYVGGNYSDTGSAERVPMNLLQLACLIYQRQLVPKMPRFMCSSQNPQAKPIAADMEAWMNKAADSMHLTDTLRRWVLDALFSLGVVKVADAPVGTVEVLPGLQFVLGQPFVCNVDLDDWVHDMLAKRFDQIEFEGNRYRTSMEAVKENKDFDKEVREKLTPMYRYMYNERGDERPMILSQGQYHPLTDEIFDHTELWDLFIPAGVAGREPLIVTVPHNETVQGGLGTPALAVKEWTGPREGPFIKLALVDVPDNIMPAAPVTAWADLSELANRILNKLAQQSDRQKTVTFYAGGATADAQRAGNASDGDIIRSDFPDRVKEMRFGGADRDQMLWLESVKQHFNGMAGNLNTLGGLSPETNTFHGDELLNKNAGAQVGEMQSRFFEGVGRVGRALGYLWYKNPFATYEAARTVDGTDLHVPVKITPAMRQMPFERMDFNVDPYSLQEDTPQARGGKLMQFLQTLLMPVLPQLQQQGISLKWPDLLKLFARYLDIPDLGDILAVGPPPDQQGPQQMAQAAAESPGKPPVTTRTSIRRGSPQMSDKGHGQVMQQLLAAGGGQPNGTPAGAR